MRIRIGIVVSGVAFGLAASATAAQKTRCERILERLGDRLADATCFESADLTTNNASTTPANNSIAGLPSGAFTPVTDRGVISPDADNKTPITKAVPGVQINAYIAGDPTGQARFLLRLPDDWNGRLVVAGASGTRSEFNGDFAWSDYVVQKGYAYASQNKGVLNLKITSLSSPTPPTPNSCRLNPASQVWVEFFDNAPDQPFSRWAVYMAEAARLAHRGVEAHYGREARRTYAVGTSNGGYQVRRAVESYPDLFDGGVDWEGTFVSPEAPNILTDLPAAVLNFPDYVGAKDPNSTAARNMLAAGYPPDIVTAQGSMWTNYWGSFWEVTQCQWQKRLDPAFVTYAVDSSGRPGTATYNYVARESKSDVAANLASFATTGAIRRPLITVAGTMDALLPIDHHARAYARKVEAASSGRHGDRDDDDAPAYRLYEVQNGNHIETYKTPPQKAANPPANTFNALEFIQPHAQKAFDLLVDSVENRHALPPSQCIPHGGSISSSPAQPGHCANLFEP